MTTTASNVCPVVTNVPAEADAALARGDRVVLIVAPGDPPQVVRPGRLALLVGEDSPATRAAAAEMEAELYARRSGPDVPS